MDKRDLADHYITEVIEEYPEMRGQVGQATIALIRACEDLLIVKDEFERYKERVIEDRRAFLAEYLNLPRGVLDSVLDRGAQDAAGEEQTPVSPDPQADPSSRRYGPATLAGATVRALLDTVPAPEPQPEVLDSLVRCPNCGEWATYTQTSDTTLVTCSYCDYEEPR